VTELYSDGYDSNIRVFLSESGVHKMSQ